MVWRRRLNRKSYFREIVCDIEQFKFVMAVSCPFHFTVYIMHMVKEFLFMAKIILNDIFVEQHREKTLTNKISQDVIISTFL